MPGSYLTTAEYKASPTAVDVNNLVAGGGQAEQDAALAFKIAQASGWIDNECNQPLIASQFTEQISTRLQRDGSLSLHPRRGHVNQLISLSVGTNGSDLVAVSSLASAFVDQQNWVIPFGPVQLGWPNSLGGGVRYGKVLAQLTGISGWPNTTLTSSPAASATSFTVSSGAGFTPAVGSACSDQTITIYDGASTEVVTVTSVAGTTITCAALAFAHTSGVAISGLPAEIKGVATDVTSAYIRVRSSEALVMVNPMQPVGQPTAWDAPRSAALANARLVLSSYGRVR